VVGTAILLLMVSAITDGRNMEVSKGMVPLYVGATVAGVGMAYGWNCNYSINPAKDMGPRLFTAVAGWGTGVFEHGAGDLQNFWWIPLLAPHVGGVLGASLYMLFVGLHWPDDRYDVTADGDPSKIPWERPS
ncbi:unnamed protein product, partial [Darwinula stevensoni]